MTVREFEAEATRRGLKISRWQGREIAFRHCYSILKWAKENEEQMDDEFLKSLKIKW